MLCLLVLLLGISNESICLASQTVLENTAMTFKVNSQVKNFVKDVEYVVLDQTHKNPRLNTLSWDQAQDIIRSNRTRKPTRAIDNKLIVFILFTLACTFLHKTVIEGCYFREPMLIVGEPMNESYDYYSSDEEPDANDSINASSSKGSTVKGR